MPGRNLVKHWWMIASKLGVRSRQALVWDRVKHWCEIASKLGVGSRQALTGDQFCTL